MSTTLTFYRISRAVWGAANGRGPLYRPSPSSPQQGDSQLLGHNLAWFSSQLLVGPAMVFARPLPPEANISFHVSTSTSAAIGTSNNPMAFKYPCACMSTQVSFFLIWKTQGWLLSNSLILSDIKIQVFQSNCHFRFIPNSWRVCHYYTGEPQLNLTFQMLVLSPEDKIKIFDSSEFIKMSLCTLLRSRKQY